jgi:hypothetical protein
MLSFAIGSTPPDSLGAAFAAKESAVVALAPRDNKGEKRRSAPI